MANDLMRTGPRGSSNQEAWVGPTTIQVNGPTGAPFDASAGAPETGRTAPLWGCDYRVRAIQILVTEAFGAASGNIDMGTNADADAYVNDFVIPNTTAAGTVLDVPMNGNDVDLAASAASPFSVLNAGGSGAAGAFIVFLLAYPVSGGELFGS
jgi:hypothetical protein